MIRTNPKIKIATSFSTLSMLYFSFLMITHFANKKNEIQDAKRHPVGSGVGGQKVKSLLPTGLR